MNPNDLQQYIRDIPDFPKKGIIFKDITPMLANPAALQACITWIADQYRDRKVTKVLGIESRGFIFGAPVALSLGAGFVPLRKPGKLPYKTLKAAYALEYGTDSIEIHADAITPGEHVLLVDDLLATGGTMKAATDLVGQMGGHIIGCAFVIELAFLNGRAKLGNIPVQALMRY